MRTNRNNEKIAKYNKLYMSFEVEPGYQKDITKSVWDYAIKVCTNGADYFKKNLISCKTATSCTIHWEYDEAEMGDKYCKFCCSSKKTGLMVNGFINSRPISEDSDTEVFYVRLSMQKQEDGMMVANCFNGHSGVMDSYSDIEDFENCWVKVSSDSEAQLMKQSA